MCMFEAGQGYILFGRIKFSLSLFLVFYETPSAFCGGGMYERLACAPVTPVTPLWHPGLIRQCYGNAKFHGIVWGCHSGVPGVWLLLGTGRV